METWFTIPHTSNTKTNIRICGILSLRLLRIMILFKKVYHQRALTFKGAKFFQMALKGKEVAEEV